MGKGSGGATDTANMLKGDVGVALGLRFWASLGWETWGFSSFTAATVLLAVWSSPLCIQRLCGRFNWHVLWCGLMGVAGAQGVPYPLRGCPIRA